MSSAFAADRRRASFIFASGWPVEHQPASGGTPELAVLLFLRPAGLMLAPRGTARFAGVEWLMLSAGAGIVRLIDDRKPAHASPGCAHLPISPARLAPAQGAALIAAALLHLPWSAKERCSTPAADPHRRPDAGANAW
jgi:hypothetical protein